MVTITNAIPNDAPALRGILTRSWMENWAQHLPPEAVERFRFEDPVPTRASAMSGSA